MTSPRWAQTSLCGFLLLLAVRAAGPPGAAADVAKTLHNLSATGPGEIKSVSEREICIFCHTPHNAEPRTPLWGHALSEVKNYKIYTSESMRANPVQPDGASKLCLSCHDGTVALGAVRGRSAPIVMRGKVTTMPSGSAGYLGTDLSGSHPLSITVTRDVIQQRNARPWELSGLKPLEVMKSDRDGVRLDTGNKIQCSSCHDPHGDTNFGSSGVHFYRKPSWSGVCEVCHDM